MRYRIGNQFFANQGLLDTHCYGETPLITVKKIIKYVNIQSVDKILEMGSGAGKVAAYFASLTGCRVTGIDANVKLIELANRLIMGCKLNDKVEFVEGDMLEYPLNNVDVIYFYHSALDDITIAKIANSLSSCDPKTRIITVSYALKEVSPQHFKTLYRFAGWFPWGITWIYIQSSIKKLCK